MNLSPQTVFISLVQTTSPAPSMRLWPRRDNRKFMVSSLADRSHGMKGQAAVGDIENQAAVFRAHADIGDLHELGSWSLTAVGNRLRGCAHLYY